MVMPACEPLTSPAVVPYRKKLGNKYAGQIQPRASGLSEEMGLREREE